MKRLFFIIAGIGLSAGFLAAEVTVTVDSAVEMALERNVSAERGKIAFEALKRASDTSWNLALPKMTASGAVRQGTATGTNTYSMSLGASLSVSPSIVKAIEKARLDYESGAITRESALRDVERSTRKAFYGILYEREYVSMLEGSVETARRQYEQALAKQRSGLVPEVDALSAQVSLERLKPTLEAARTALLGDLATFKKLVGIEQGETVSLSGSLAEALVDESIDLSGVTPMSAAVAKLEKNLEIARAMTSVTKASYLFPSFSLAYSYNPTKTDVPGAKWEDAGYVSASVTLALDGYLPFSSAGNAIKAAKDSVRDAELALADGRVSDAIERDSILREIERSLSSLKAHRLAVELAERTYDLTNEAYRNGTRDLLRLQDAADSLTEARTNLMKEEYALVSAVLDLEYATGVPFGTLGRK